MVNRVTFGESGAIEDVASLEIDTLTWVDWKLGTLTGKIGHEVVFGDRMTVK